MSNSDWSALDLTEVSNKKLAAGLLGILLGSFGIHKFVLGYTKAGLIMGTSNNRELLAVE